MKSILLSLIFSFISLSVFASSTDVIEGYKITNCGTEDFQNPDSVRTKSYNAYCDYLKNNENEFKIFLPSSVGETAYSRFEFAIIISNDFSYKLPDGSSIVIPANNVFGQAAQPGTVFGCTVNGCAGNIQWSYYSYYAGTGTAGSITKSGLTMRLELISYKETLTERKILSRSVYALEKRQ